MKLLALDSSGKSLSVSLFDGERKLGGIVSDGTTRDAHTLTANIERLLKSTRMRLGRVDAVAVCVGPGSFTGLRIGVTAAKALCYAAGLKCVAVSSLEAVAVRSTAERVAVMLDAGRGNVYGAHFTYAGGGRTVQGGPRLMDRSGFLGTVTAGTALIENEVPDADSVARAAWARIKKKRFEDPMKLLPLYLYPRDCNVTRPRPR